jgi:gliding motility-associated-like protein
VAIIASRVTIPSDYGIFGIQSGPDGKIYLNHGATSLSVITSPNTKGPGCKYEFDKIKLANKIARLGLPSFINDISFNPLTDFTYQVIDTCAATTQFIASTNIPGAVSWFWDFGDGGTSSIQNPLHSFGDPGRAYTVKLRVIPANACGYVEKSKEVYPAGIAANAAYSFSVNCDSQSVSFTNQSFVSVPVSENYYWDFGDGQTSTAVNPVHIFPAGGNYNTKLVIRTGMNCIDDSITKILSIQKLNINASPDATVDEGKSLQLNVAGGGSSFQWSPSTWLNNPGIPSPVTTPFEDIMYKVTAANLSGCTATDSVFIKVNTINDMYVPSAFTPNNDNLNDVLRPYMGAQFKLEAFNVYDRWGKSIFTTSIKGIGWDGKINNIPQPSGVFVWTLQAREKDGKPVTKKGTVTLIR